MRRRGLLLGLTAAVALALLAASAYAWTRDDGAAEPGSVAGTTDQVARGRTLFQSVGCAACHHLATAGITDGFGTAPSLTNISQVAASRVEGQSAEAYLRASIVSPDAFIAPGGGGTFSMPSIKLTSEEVDALVAFLLAEGDQTFSIGVSS